MVISLIHPSRGRAIKSAMNHREWMDKAGDVEIETVVSVDLSDKTHPEYIRAYGGMCHVVNNTSVVEATNYAAAKSTGDILLYLSDDFKCHDNWAMIVLKEFQDVMEPMILRVDDCLQPFSTPVITIPIMNRALYEKLGYFFHPDYKSMFVDEDLYQTCSKLGVIKFNRNIKFPHEHVSIGKAKDDETYRNSARNWDQGKSMFAKRKTAGFPV